MPQVHTLPRYYLPVQVLYIGGTAVCNFLGVHTVTQAGSRAAQLAMSNLVPALYSSSHGFGSQLFGISLRSYESIHRTVGLMVLIQSLVHAVITIHASESSLTEGLRLHGLLGAIMLFILVALPLIRKYQYELFGILHLASAIFLAYSLWRHVETLDMMSKICVLTSAGLFLTISVLHLMRSLFRNFTFKNALGRLTLMSESHSDTLTSNADAYRVDISLSRPWKVKAGEWINLTLPAVGFLYTCQAHPFTVAWWEEDEAGYASSISLLIKKRSGFTQRLLKQVQPYTEYRAWIDGPYGPARTNSYSFSGVGDYGHLIMFATDIGIAAHLPYIKETLKGIKQCRVKTRTICLVWQMNKADDLDLVRHWLQQLVAEDENYHLKLLVYNSSENASPRDPVPYGQHDRILISGGEPNWDDHLQNEMKETKGKLLVMSECRNASNSILKILIKE
ncbi:hypothetical protein EMCG_07088 [[Emmonsia] crescens]|uniref:ferric-chelate reductase (NADPH) n=1 Tax=[Emmonsia] crescens TaxID=73230 RepID=A0A0G2I9A1_9EURO|nr:hypothetical protein EMCG_07088 [Emmonsia crescens UAMH 3008]